MDGASSFSTFGLIESGPQPCEVLSSLTVNNAIGGDVNLRHAGVGTAGVLLGRSDSAE